MFAIEIPSNITVLIMGLMLIFVTLVGTYVVIFKLRGNPQTKYYEKSIN